MRLVFAEELGDIRRRIRLQVDVERERRRASQLLAYLAHRLHQVRVRVVHSRRQRGGRRHIVRIDVVVTGCCCRCGRCCCCCCFRASGRLVVVLEDGVVEDALVLGTHDQLPERDEQASCREPHFIVSRVSRFLSLSLFFDSLQSN